jgi:hypothetical protein
MIKGKGGMGMHKHGVSGINPKSPKQRLFERMEAEKDKTKKPEPEMFSSIKDLLKNKENKDV